MDQFSATAFTRTDDRFCREIWSEEGRLHPFAADLMVFRPPNILKIDLEGAELEVLLGAPSNRRYSPELNA